MAFEPEVACHPAIFLDPAAIPGLVAAHPCQQRPQTQQRDVMQDEAGIGWYCGQSVHRGLRMIKVTITVSLHQHFDQHRGGQGAPDGSARFIQGVERHPH